MKSLRPAGLSKESCKSHEKFTCSARTKTLSLGFFLKEFLPGHQSSSLHKLTANKTRQEVKKKDPLSNIFPQLSVFWRFSKWPPIIWECTKKGLGKDTPYCKSLSSFQHKYTGFLTFYALNSSAWADLLHFCIFLMKLLLMWDISLHWPGRDTWGGKRLSHGIRKKKNHRDWITAYNSTELHPISECKQVVSHRTHRRSWNQKRSEQQKSSRTPSYKGICETTSCHFVILSVPWNFSGANGGQCWSWSKDALKSLFSRTDQWTKFKTIARASKMVRITTFKRPEW